MTTLVQLLLASSLIFTTAALGSDVYTESLITTDVIDGAPANRINVADTTTPNTYYFSIINNCKGCTVAHAWYLDGSFIYQYQITTQHNKTKWWTARPGNGIGTWEVRLVLNGQEVESATLEYQLASIVQQQELTVQKRLNDRVDTECEDNLEYFGAEAAKHPEDPYYTFMYKKWASRCN